MGLRLVIRFSMIDLFLTAKPVPNLIRENARAQEFARNYFLYSLAPLHPGDYASKP
jgi:hypothetical protein